MEELKYLEISRYVHCNKQCYGATEIAFQPAPPPVTEKVPSNDCLGQA